MIYFIVQEVVKAMSLIENDEVMLGSMLEGKSRGAFPVLALRMYWIMNLP